MDNVDVNGCIYGCMCLHVVCSGPGVSLSLSVPFAEVAPSSAELSAISAHQSDGLG